MSIISASDAARPRILVINPNSTEEFSIAMKGTIREDDIPTDFYTPSSADSPLGIEGTVDSIVSAAAVLKDLKDRLGEWDGFVVACFSAHPLVNALRELTTAPAVSILDAPLLLASQISTSVGILTTSPRWVPLLEHDLHIQHATALCTAGVVSSGMSVLDLERLPREQVLSTLGRIAKEELVDRRGASAIVLGCAGMVGLRGEVEKACGEGVRVVDPVESGVAICKSLVRLGMKTSKGRSHGGPAGYLDIPWAKGRQLPLTPPEPRCYFGLATDANGGATMHPSQTSLVQPELASTSQMPTTLPSVPSSSQRSDVAGPSRPTSRNSLRSNLSAQLSGLFSRNSLEANERTNLLPSTSHSRESSGRDRPSGEGSENGIRRNYTQEMDVEDDEDDGKIPTAARSPIRPQKKRSNTIEIAKKIRQRSKYYIPITEWLPQYSLPLFYGDLTAGVSLACLLVPQAMSYASGLAKLTPVAGIWSTAIPSVVYGIFGTCRQLSVGPEAALALLIGQMIEEVVNDPHHPAKHPELEAAAVAIITTFQIGLITSVLGLLRLGFLDVVLSRALLRGFITAVGVIIFIEQSIPMLGLSSLLSQIGKTHNAPSLPLDKFIFVIRNIHQINRPTAILSAGCLAFLILMRVGKARVVKRPGGGWVRYFPEIFAAVVGLTFLAGQLRWDLQGVDILGEVPGGTAIPFGWPLDKRRMKYFSFTFPTAFVCAVVGMVDSIVAARENGSKYGYAVGPNRELVALGAANLVSSCMVVTGSIPIFGSITRSRLNGATGARTQIASAITAVIMVGSIFLLPWLYFLPKAVLACIVVLVVYSILAEAPHEIIFLWRMRAWTDFAQMTGTFILTLLFSIETGLVASVVFSLILVIQKSTQTRIKIIGRLPNTDEWVPIDEDEAAQEEIPGVLVVRIRENLSFANTGQLKERLRRLELYGMQKSHPSDVPRRESAKAIILHMGDVEDIDASALQILFELTQSYSEQGVGLHFVHLRPAHLTMFHFVGITEICSPRHFHRDLREAMKEIESLGYGSSVISRYVT